MSSPPTCDYTEMVGAMLSQLVCNEREQCKTTAKACGNCKIRMLSRQPSFISHLLPISPQPPQRLGQNGAAVFAVMAAGAVLEFVIIFGELERQGHLLI